MVKYEADLVVPPDFGEVGAILVENEHHKEMHLTDILLDGLPFGSVHFNCNTWVHPKFDNPEKRIFFTNKVRKKYKNLNLLEHSFHLNSNKIYKLRINMY